MYARPSVFSYDRMAFMLSIYLPDYSLKSCKQILKELKKLRDEEVYMRNLLLNEGVRDPGNNVKLQRFKLAIFDENSSQHDDRRM
mmetsp:Transcript_17874/g.26473  ORF Transcript_17874/g.26473 Transcript_17874/m.26473 type:complete len:85 (-) Transcript_17874:665-919(-)